MVNIPFSSGHNPQRFYVVKVLNKYMEGESFNNRWAAFKVDVDGHLRTALAGAEIVDVDLVEQAIGLEGVVVEMTRPGDWHSLKFRPKTEWMEITRFEAEQRLKSEAPAPEPPITKDQPSFDDMVLFRIHRLEEHAKQKHKNEQEINLQQWKLQKKVMRDEGILMALVEKLGIKLDSSKDHDPEGFTEEPFEDEDEDEDDDDQLDWLGQKPDHDW